MSTTQAILEALLQQGVYRASSKEIKEHLKELSRKYGEPKATHGEVREMMDRYLGQKTLSGEVSKLREDQS